MPDSPAKPPRFPYVGALLCAACVGMTVWTWMRYSYAWPMTPKTLSDAVGGSYATLTIDSQELYPSCWPKDSFVTLRGVPRHGLEDSYPRIEYAKIFPGRKLLVHEPGTMRTNAWVHCGGADPTGFVAADEFTGRIYYDPEPITVDMTASRFTGASIAGLVVGAMGVFVFTVALRHWLGERRKFREEARA